MALQVWLPLNGNLNNQGLIDANVTNNGSVVNNNGKIGKCYEIGEGKSILVSNLIDFSAGCSIACWAKLTTVSGPTTQYILDVATSSNADTVLGLEVTNGSQTVLIRYNNSTLSTSYSIPLNTWCHLCATYNGTDIKFYANGELIKTSAQSITYNTGQIGIGRRPGSTGYYPSGFINDVRVYDHCLSAKEVKEISQGLVLHYKLDDEYAEGTTNTMGANAENFAGWSSYGFGSKGIKSIVTDKTPAISGQVCRVTSSASTSVTSIEMAVWTAASQLQSGGTATLSAYVKGEGSSIGRYCYLHVYNSNSGVTQSDNVTYSYLTDEWQRLSGTFVWKGSVVSSPSFTVYVVTNMPKDEAFYISNVQFEIKDHVTPYVNGTRAAGAQIIDNSGYGNNGTVTGTLTMSSASPRYDKYTLFNNGRISLNYPITSNVFTYSWWMYVTDWTPDTTNWSYLEATNLFIYRDHNASATFTFMFNAGGTKYSTFLTQSIAKSGWNHICAVSDGNSVKGYINGSLYNTITGTVVSPSGTFYMGYTNGKDIRMSDFRIYATALSAEDILDLYHTSASIDKRGNLHCFQLKED